MGASGSIFILELSDKTRRAGRNFRGFPETSVAQIRPGVRDRADLKIGHYRWGCRIGAIGMHFKKLIFVLTRAFVWARMRALRGHIGLGESGDSFVNKGRCPR